MKKRDILIVFLVILTAFLLFLPKSAPAECVRITVNGEIFCEKPLTTDCEIDINGTNTAVIEKGAVYMKSADCPDKLCIKQGAVRDGAKKIVCLPNRVIIELTKKSEVDTVVK